VAHSARGSHACKSPLDDTTYEAFPVIRTPALALTAMRSFTPASPRSQLLSCHCPVFPWLVFDLPCSRKVIAMAVFARQQAEQDMEHGRRARLPYQP
jgi:hypothetical protein